MNPTLTPTEAPTFFVDAFEDAEREYWTGFPGDYQPPAWAVRVSELVAIPVFLSADDLMSAWGIPLQDVVRKPISFYMEFALYADLKCIVLCDAEGKTVKQWSVTA